MTEHTGACYQGIADKYAEAVDTKPWNAYYERPAVLSLLPSLANAKVLDVGCGSGWYAELSPITRSWTASYSAPRTTSPWICWRMSGRALHAVCKTPTEIREARTSGHDAELSFARSGGGIGLSCAMDAWVSALTVVKTIVKSCEVAL